MLEPDQMSARMRTKRPPPVPSGRKDTPMQTTTSTHRFGFNRMTGSVAAVGIAAAFVAGIVGGAIGQAALDDTDSANSASAPQAIVRPKSYDNPGQGEGAM